MTSLATQYWHLFRSRGMCTGLGRGLLFNPAYSLLHSISTRNAPSLWGYDIPWHRQVSFPKIGFAWTVRAIGFLILGTRVDKLASQGRAYLLGRLARWLNLPPSRRNLIPSFRSVNLGHIWAILFHEVVRSEPTRILRSQCGQPSSHHQRHQHRIPPTSCMCF